MKREMQSTQQDEALSSERESDFRVRVMNA